MIHYIGYYVDKNNENEYSYNVPGLKKMQYVAASLKRAGEEVSIFSVCRKKKNGRFTTKRITTEEGYNLTYRATSLGGLFEKVLDKIQFSREIDKYIKTQVRI